MKIPKKIFPDNISNAILEIKYEASIPFEIMVGYIFKALDDTYFYTNRYTNEKEKTNLNGINLFLKNDIKIEILPNSIVFNCIDKYVGWDNYKIVIGDFLEQINRLEEIISYTQIGLRYISEYPNKELEECSNFEFSFGMKDVKSKSYIFRSEFNIRDFIVFLGLQHKVKLDASNKFLTLIDIDVIKKGLLVKKDVKMLLEQIEDSHNIEKEVFFKVLKNEFLQTLSPEY
jgi:uncharacterized protein (TIGR04255 family)